MVSKDAGMFDILYRLYPKTAVNMMVRKMGNMKY